MMRSMFSAVSGLRIHQTKMDVIANNISNVNTVGYKSSRVTFSEIFTQTLSGAGGANPVTGRGGTNPMQIGLGANVASIDLLMTTGGAQRTDNPYDIMIQGDGFFIVKDGSGTYFTRAGAFRIDEAGNLTMPNGMTVCGWDTSYDEGSKQWVVQKTEAAPIRLAGADLSVDPEVTTAIEFEGNINPYTDKVKDSSISFYDSLGNEYTLKVQYNYNAANKNWDVKVGNYMYYKGENGKQEKVYIGTPAASATQPGVVPIDADNSYKPFGLDIKPSVPPTPAPAFSYNTVAGMGVSFTELGYMDTNITTGKNTSFVLNMDNTAVKTVISPLTSFSNQITVDLTKMTQFNDVTNAAAYKLDGNTAGTLTGVSIGTDGIIQGRFSNGQTKALAQIAIAQFKNPAGLEKIGNNLFVETRNSGEFDGIGVDPGSGGSSLLGGVLEMSNVDLSQEFTEMITTQRGFQANSRVITTSDDMLQELVNLKR